MRIMMKSLLLGALLFFIPLTANASIWYLRTDGGTNSQCTGLADAPYPGSGTGQACALNHPNWVFPPRGESTTTQPTNGDTVVIEGSAQHGTGSYRVGCQGTVDCRDASVNLTNSANCAAAFPYDCYETAIPNGVTVIGCTTSGCGSGTKPQLWGSGGVGHVLSAAGSTNVTIQDLEITDHAQCGQNNGDFSCGSGVNNTAAADGIDQTGSTNLILRKLYIHGMYRYGVYGGSNTSPTYDHLNIDKNAFGGINFDSCGDGTCGETGNLIFNFTTVSFSGCIEDYPVDGTANQPSGIALCYDSNNSGYGDGVATNLTGANWYFYNSDISHNASDGIDLLYHDNTGTVLLSRTRAEGNIGQQLKTAALNNIVENSKLVGNCQYLQTAGVTLKNSPNAFTLCRASGSTIIFSPIAGNQDTIDSSSVWGEDGTIIDYGSFGNANTCNGTENLTVKGSIFFGEPSVSGSGSNSSWFYCSGTDGNGSGACCATHPPTLSVTYTDVWNTKDAPVSGTGNINQNPKWTIGDDISPEVNSDNYDFDLLVSSPAINAGTNSITFQNGSQDFNQFARSGTYDQGGFEYGTTTSLTPNGLFCLDSSDCASGNCTSNACAAVASSGSVWHGTLKGGLR